MKSRVQVRGSVFETNSSSSHSLTLAGARLVRAPFDKAVVRAGTVTIAPGEYGWEWGRFYRLDGKLAYLLTDLLAGATTPPADSPLTCAAALRDEHPQFDQLCQLVEKQTGVTVGVAPGQCGYIDHQSEHRVWRQLSTSTKCKQLLFGADSYIETGNDNGYPPLFIDTDRGREPYYPDRMAAAPAGAVQVRATLTRNRETWGWQVRFPSGTYQPLAYHERSGLRLSEVFPGAVVTSAVRVEPADGAASYHLEPSTVRGALGALVAEQGVFVSPQVATRGDHSTESGWLLTLAVAPKVKAAWLQR